MKPFPLQSLLPGRQIKLKQIRADAYECLPIVEFIRYECRPGYLVGFVVAGYHDLNGERKEGHFNCSDFQKIV